MECIKVKVNEYQILFIYNECTMKIFAKDNKNDKLRYKPIKFLFEDNLTKYTSNFKDLINQIKNKIILIELKKHLYSNSLNKSNENLPIKYLELNLIKKDNELNKSEIIISRKIYVLNVEYYITKDISYQRINSKPFLSYITKDNINREDILELIDKEKILNDYILDNFRYYNNEKGVFQTLKNDNIKINEKIILEFHIYGKKNILNMNLKWTKEYYENEIIKIKNKINKLSDSSKQYDLIYLYASPIINKHFDESISPISYMDEIRIILELMKNKKKKFNIKFECINEDVLEDIIINNKTKILHISSHGDFNGKYSLIAENLSKYGQKQIVGNNKLEMILDSGKSNINKMDLVILTTCYSGDFGKLFLDYGVKNVICIHRETKVNDRISVLFAKYFYQNILEGKSIKESHKNALDLLNLNKEVIKINNESCCCNHYHNPEFCLIEKNKDGFHKNVHKQRIEKCKCIKKTSNYHDDVCEYFELFKNNLSKYKKNNEVKSNEEQIINKKACCCYNHDIEHDEVLKIMYESQDNNSNITLYKLNRNGKLFINSTIRFDYDTKKFDLTLGRRNIIGKIFNNIKNNENYAIFYGEKDLLKTDFAESLCVYLYERKIINNYEIFIINSEYDFEYVKNQIRDNLKNNDNIIIKKKNIQIIEFNFNLENDEDKKKSFEYLNQIYKEFCLMNNNEYYFIFIFDTKNREKENIKNNIDKDMIINDNNIFYLGIDLRGSMKIINSLIKGKNIKISDDEKIELLRDIAEYKPKKIKLISELLINGESAENIKKMKNLELANIILNKDKQSFPLYYLLYNMPLGLPNSFLELIFENYKEIDDDKNIISQKLENNWNYINVAQRIEENFNENEYMNICYKYIFKTLKLYTKLLIFFIEKNKEKINCRNGNIHYLFNSYSNRNIWNSKIYNAIETLNGDIIYKQDFNIENHKQNILNTISLIINKIELFRNLTEWPDDYLEEILLLFPSFFFLQKDNINLLQICIDLCKKLLKKTNAENLQKREEYLRQKLLLFLYSIDENKNEILNINKIINSDLELEINFLKVIRKKNKNINNFLNLLPKASNEIMLYIYHEIAIIYFKNENFSDSMENLKNILNLKYINNIYKNRIILDYIYIFIKKFIRENEGMENHIIEGKEYNNVNENYKLIKKQIKELNDIIAMPYQIDIYKEAFKLKDKIYNDLFEPNIVMLNSNPLKNISNNVYSLNNQYYILNKLKNDINEHIILKSYV